MDDKTREFGLFIDGLRIERNLSREDLCDGIMSLSQYKRYLRGDTSIPNAKLVQLADRLMFSISDIYSLFGKRHNEIYKKIWNIYNLIKKNKSKEALVIAEELRKDIFVTQYNELFYDYCMIKIQHNLKMVSDIHVLNLYSKLIDYPACTNNESYNLVEISALIGIVNISASIGNYEPMNFMYNILTSKSFNYTVSGDYSFLPSVYSTISRSFGAQNEHEKVLEMSQMGIDFCLKHETSNALSHLLFYKSISLLSLNRREEGMEEAKKCIMQLYIENNPENLSNYSSVIEEAYNIKIKDLIKF